MAEALIRTGLCRLLVGNMYTMRPDLFGAVHCAVPLLDMRRYRVLLAEASGMAE